MGPGLKNVRGAGAADVAMTCTTLEKDIVIVSRPSPLEDTDQFSLVKARRHKSCQSAPAVELSLTGVYDSNPNLIRQVRVVLGG